MSRFRSEPLRLPVKVALRTLEAQYGKGTIVKRRRFLVYIHPRTGRITKRWDIIGTNVVI